MKAGEAVVTSYCVGRVMSYNSSTQRVQVLHRLSKHYWVVKNHHKDDVMSYKGILWSMSDAF